MTRALLHCSKTPVNHRDKVPGFKESHYYPRSTGEVLKGNREGKDRQLCLGTDGIPQPAVLACPQASLLPEGCRGVWDFPYTLV